METNKNEPLLKYRNLQESSKPGADRKPGISLEDNLITVQMATGIEVV
ncbi:hypothetical protein LMF89_21385 [Pelosinus sp. Bkl1]|uniref:Uncharacterized protein n=1 Tax=Pelosinus baikalensis TaxID=2892015 RepID=A0ABS8HXJ9_9FIRM|nr:hypothetical protein [Pelosinus baikalensis]